MVDDAPYLVLAAQTRNSSAWPSRLPLLWPALEYDHVNTVEIPVYWNQVEAQPGKYDFTMVDMILAEARKHQVHVIPLWFATWKNGSQHFMPDWMKMDTARYAHDVNKNGETVDSPSPFATASLEADKAAFTALMQHLKQVDAQRTVIMVQVENEPGSYGTVRDYSPAAQKFFDGPVPVEVLRAMHVNAAANATWQQAFGADADEYFNAWAVAKYVGQVAAAGKAVYALPMYANAALRNPLTPGSPSGYESGGPTDNVLPIWKAAAPSLDLLAPDNYQTDPAAYLKDLELYHRADNPLFLPETGHPENARFFFKVLGFQGIGFSPSGGNTEAEFAPTDHSKARFDALEPWAQNYRLIGPMQREIARLNFEGKLQAVAEEKGKTSGDTAVWDVERASGVWGDGARAGGGESHADGAGAGGATEREPVPDYGILLPHRLQTGRNGGAAEVATDCDWERAEPVGADRWQVGAPSVCARGGGDVRERSLQVPAHVERGRDGLGVEVRRGPGGAAGDAGDVLGAAFMALGRFGSYRTGRGSS